MREVVTQKHMTTNLPEAEMVASVGEIVNFTDDIIPLVGFKIYWTGSGKRIRLL